MKRMRYLILIVLFVSLAAFLQGCGSGGGSSDTSGNLTIGTPTSSNNTGLGTSIVTFTVTYTPPPGKSAQGVVVNVSYGPAGGTPSTTAVTLNSLTNTVSFSFIGTNSTIYSINAFVDGMSSGLYYTVPAGA